MTENADELLLQLAELTRPKAVQEAEEKLQKQIEQDSVDNVLSDAIEESKEQLEHLLEIKSQIEMEFEQVSASYKAKRDEILQYKSLLTELTDLNNMYELAKQSPTNLASAEAAIELLQEINPNYMHSLVDSFLSKKLSNITQEEELFIVANNYYEHVFKALDEKLFKLEADYVQELVDNKLGPQMTIYDLIHFVESKMQALTQSVLQKDFSDYAVLSKSCVKQIRKQYFLSCSEEIENLFGMFCFRYFSLIQHEYDIIFMQSSEYNREKSVKMQAAVEFVLDQILQYFTNICEAMDIEQLIPNLLEPFSRDLLLINTNVDYYNKNIVSKVITSGYEAGKKLLQQLNAFVKINSENGNIKQIFARFYPIEDSNVMMQIFVDLIAKVVYRMCAKSCDMMGQKQQQFKSEYGVNLLYTIYKCQYGEFISRTVQSIVETVSEWLADGYE